jgi:hypothetical protein
MTSPLTDEQLDSYAELAITADHDGIKVAPAVVTALVDEVRRLTARVAELEAYAYGCDAEGCVIPHSSWCEAAKRTAAANNGCTCGKPWTGHPQPHAMHCWTVNPPRAEVEEMRRALAAARTTAVDWAANVVDAKLTAEPDHTRASALYEVLLHLRGELPCTCARSGGLHAKDCRKYVPGHELASPANALDTYRRTRPAP